MNESKAKAWEEAKGRLETLSVEEVSRLRKGFKAEVRVHKVSRRTGAEGTLTYPLTQSPSFVASPLLARSSQLASFAKVAEGREIRARRMEKEREVIKCAIDIVEETVKGFAKGIYNEILGVTRFTEGHAKEALLSALGSIKDVEGEQWEQSMWGRCFDQIVKERKKDDHSIDGETGVRRVQRLR